MTNTPTTHPLTGYRAEWARRADFADSLRALAPEQIRSALAVDFMAEHAEHRQYDGWTDGAVLLRARHRISGKGGVRAEPGDYLLGHRRPGLGLVIGPDWTAYAPRVGWNLGGLTAGDVEVVDR